MAIIDKIQLSGTVYTIGNETTTAVTSASTDNEIPTAKAVYDAIPKGGVGKAIEAGTNISITTGETADTINCTLPISGGTGTNALIYNSTINVASGDYSHSEGYISKAEGYASHAEGLSTKSKGFGSHAEGYFTITTNESEHSSGRYNNSVSSSTTFGDSGNTLFSVGNGTANNARHNAFEIRQNGDIYITKDGQDIKLQDQLGGGGTSYTAGDGIDITNDVISVTGKVDTSAFTAHTADTVIHVTSDEKAAWNDKQDTLVSGTNIKTINGETLLGEGNITIEGGSSINVVQTTGTSTSDVMSQDAVTTKLKTKLDVVRVEPKTPTSNYTQLNLYLEKNGGGVQSLFTYIKTINGKSITSQKNNNLEGFSLIETSAITTSITSASTDAQVPSAKSVYDQLGGLKLVKLSQSEYDSLSTKDNSTLYIIVN